MHFEWRALILVVCIISAASADSWRWPDSESAESVRARVRVDDKVRFTDEVSRRPRPYTSIQREQEQTAQSEVDVEPFSAPSDTQGFYNRPGEVGRYHVRVEPPPVEDAADSAGRSGEYGLTLAKLRPSGSHSEQVLESLEPSRSLKNRKPIEYFNEVDAQYKPQDDRLLQLFTPGDAPDQGPSVLTGPRGPTGVVGPQGLKDYDRDAIPPILSGPEPSGLIGPRFPSQNTASASAQRGVLVGPRGPTGIIGPAGYNNRQTGYNNRQVLVGPTGPTGMIGPQGFNNRPVLVGPGGPTGLVGPAQRPFSGGSSYGGVVRPYGYNNNRQNQYNRGILVGPGGPSGTIGPGRGLLVGPGGPSGVIGPRRNDYGI